MGIWKKRAVCFAVMCGLSSSFAAVLQVSAEDYSGIIESGQVYYISNCYSGKYLEVSTDKAGASLWQKDFDGGIKQQFQLVLAEGTGEEAVYSIVPQANPGLRLDITNASAKNGAKVKLFTPNQQYAYAQQFQVKTNGDGTARLVSGVSTKSEMALEVAGPSKGELSPVQIWEYAQRDNQQWQLIPADEMTVSSPVPEPPIADYAVIMYALPDMMLPETSKLPFAFANQGHLSVNVGNQFKLEKKQGGSWKPYHPRTSVFWDLNGYLVPSGDIHYFNISFSEFTNRPLTVGKYRVVKDYSCEGLEGTFTVMAEFSVVDDEEQVKNISIPE